MADSKDSCRGTVGVIAGHVRVSAEWTDSRRSAPVEGRRNAYQQQSYSPTGVPHAACIAINAILGPTPGSFCSSSTVGGMSPACRIGGEGMSDRRWARLREGDGSSPHAQRRSLPSCEMRMPGGLTLPCFMGDSPPYCAMHMSVAPLTNLALLRQKPTP